MLAIYLIVAVIIAASFFYFAGQWEKPEKMYSFWDDQAEIVKVGLFVAIFWPCVITLLIVLGPFAFLFYLGARKKAKRDAKKAVD